MHDLKEFIIDQIAKGNYRLTIHAQERMNERHVTHADLINVAQTSESCEHQVEKDTYLIRGKSCWDEAINIVAAVRNDIIIVTVFYKEEI